jgi:Mg/Co/Ni transporter MgtE
MAEYHTDCSFANGLRCRRSMITAGPGRYVAAASRQVSRALLAGFIVRAAMIGSYLVSGICRVLIPLTLKPLRADSATASSSLVTTANDVASMALFLRLISALIR